MSALYPNVPIAPGVPAVARSIDFPADLSLLDELSDSGPEVNADIAQQWGLYTQDGDFAAPADNVVGVEVALEARISDYPVEQGGFGSYNKVIVPYDVRLIMSRGGSVEDRQDFLQAIQDAYDSTELFNVVTPECVYLDVNVVGVRRVAAADRGMGLLTLEIVARKVRETANLAFSNTKEPTGAKTNQNGSVQAQPTEQGIDPEELQPR